MIVTCIFECSISTSTLYVQNLQQNNSHISKPSLTLLFGFYVNNCSA